MEAEVGLAEGGGGSNGALKVGSLAKRTGMTVRTLHHYDEIGLLSPSRRTPSGHRLYAEEDVRKLQQIVSLKQIGLPLDEIRACLERPEYTLDEVLDLQIRRIETGIEQQRQLHELLTRLRERLRSADTVSVEELTRTIGVTMSFEKYYSAAQLHQLEARRDEIGDARISEAEQEWADLFEAYGHAMDDGAAPSSERVLALARRSRALIEEFTGGDAGIRRSLDTMYETEGPYDAMEGQGTPMRPGLWEFMGEARKALAESG